MYLENAMTNTAIAMAHRGGVANDVGMSRRRSLEWCTVGTTTAVGIQTATTHFVGDVWSGRRQREGDQDRYNAQQPAPETTTSTTTAAAATITTPTFIDSYR